MIVKGCISITVDAVINAVIVNFQENSLSEKLVTDLGIITSLLG